MVDSVTGGAKKSTIGQISHVLTNAEAKSKENVIPAPMDIKAIRSSILVLLWSVVANTVVLGIEILHHISSKYKVSTGKRIKRKMKALVSKVTTTKVVVINVRVAEMEFRGSRY